MTKQLTIEALAEKTDDSYSYDRYGDRGWRDAIRVLRGRNMHDQEVEAFLRSKHMRWASDCDGERFYGQHNGLTVEEYLAEYPQYASQAKLNELVEGTF